MIWPARTALAAAEDALKSAPADRFGLRLALQQAVKNLSAALVDIEWGEQVS